MSNSFTSGPNVWGDPTLMFQEAQTLIAGSGTYLAALTAQAGQLAAPVINPSFPTVANAPIPASASLPPLDQVVWTVPVEPADFTGSITPINFPALTAVQPTLNFGTPVPSFALAAPPTPAVNTNFVYPTLSVNLPTAPTLLSLNTITFNPIAIPTFTTQPPTLTAVAPGAFNFREPALFTSALLTQLETDLQNSIASGVNLSLPNQAQQALLDAAYEREYRQQANALAELERMETLGYAFPPGAFIDARVKLQTETNYTMAGISREILATQYKTQLDNLVQARQAATALESKLIDYANEVSQRTFEATKYATEAAIAIYNAQVQAFTASLEGFKAQVLVYETQIKGIEAQIRETMNQIEFEKTKAEINKITVDEYVAEVQAQQTVVDIYKAQLEAIQIQAQIQKLKIDIFAQQIAAFVGQVNAYTAQVEGYKAQVEAQGVIESVYKTQVDAYSSQVQASAAQINANVSVFRGQIDAYQARLAGYDAAIKGMVGQAQAASLFNTATADVYRSQVAAITSYNGTLTGQWEAIINEQEKITEIAVQSAKANGDLYIAARGLSLDASKVGAQVNAQLGAAALGAISWHTSSQASTSSSDSTTSATSFSTSTSNVTSTSESNSNVTSNSNSNSNAKVTESITEEVAQA